MRPAGFAARLHRRVHRELGGVLYTRCVRMRNCRPLISFTFDDFPRSAVYDAGDILEEHGIRATYYASLGLIGQQSPVGEIFTEKDLAAVLDAGHEVGCHTFRHSNSWEAGAADFERSILENRVAMGRLFPAVSLRTFSFPHAHPRLDIKRLAARHFQCCRGGGQTFNHTVVDLNLLSCYFLEQSAGDLDAVKKMIDRNRAETGWLIFATHDVRDHPSRFGCTRSFFRDAARQAVSSGALLLPVSQALEVAEGAFGGKLHADPVRRPA
jgi:peptidoglycan/xylan/chitin deacetylase (PgdA/CDA1 family)